MVSTCCVAGCNGKNPEVILHRFPSGCRDLKRYNEWITKVGREDLRNRPREAVCKSYVVCDKHFSAKQKIVFNRNISNLRRDAVPDEFLSGPFPQHGKFLRNASRYQKIMSRLYSGSNKPKVYLTRQINPEALKFLQEHCDVEIYTGPDAVPRDELLKNVVGKQGLYCLLTEKIDKELIEAGSDLKVVSTMSVGYDHIDTKALLSKNIRIGYTPRVLRESVAELTITLLLTVARRIVEGVEEARSGGWATWSPFWMCGGGLKDKVIGMVGCGDIGGTVLRQANVFYPKELLYFNRERRTELEDELCAEKVSFTELLERSDYVVVCISFNKETKNMFNEEAFKKMKKTAFLINTARGGIVDQDALVKALEDKQIAGAGLDVTVPEPLPLDSPLFKMKNVVILPHIGSATYLSRNAMAMLAAKNLVGGLQGADMPAELTK